MEALFFSEIEKFPCAVLAQRYPNVTNHGDITKFKEWPDEKIDLLVVGTPCQSFSVAGLRKGLDDPRGNLMLTYLAVAEKFKPRWLVWENVPGVLSSGQGRHFGTFLGALGQLGYGWAYRVLDAQYFGVPQRRRRVFVVGYLGDWRRAAAVLFERQSLSGNPPPSRKTKEEGAGTLKARAKSGGWSNDVDMAASGYMRVLKCADVTTVDARNNVDRGDQQHLDRLIVQNSMTSISPTLREGGNKTGGNRPPGTDVDTVESLITFSLRTNQTSANGHGIAEDVAHTLDSTNGQAVCWTLNASGAGTSRPAGQCNKLDFCIPCNISGVRRLTPTECARLQGFPDNYLDIEFRGHPSCDGNKYKALGNSMAVPVMRWIGERIRKVDSKTSVDSPAGL